MHCRNCPLDGSQNVAIEKSVKVAGQSSLDADFCGPSFPSLHSLARYIVGRKEVCIRGARPASKSAEAAAHEANISEIDVAVDNVSDRIAVGFPAQVIRHGD